MQATSAWTEVRSRRRTVYTVAALSMTAALVHLWAAPEHFVEWWGYGIFFLGAASFQGFYAVALLRWSGRLLPIVGIWGNAAIVLLYVMTRTSGVPLGPRAGEIEAAGLVDMSATAAEMGIIVVLATLLGGRLRAGTINALLLVGVAIWALRFAGIIS